jgi:hypothetical protein
MSSSPSQSGPPQQSSGAWTIALVIIAAVGVMMLVCCGGVAFLGTLFYTRADRVAAQVQKAVQNAPAAPAPAQGWQNEWIAIAQLAPAYSAALDAVAADKPVQEKLGEPIEPASDSESLFRRDKNGNWTGGEETIEFDIRGPKGTAVVRVVAAGSTLGMAPGAAYDGMWPSSITVTLKDGTEMTVPPPMRKDMP